MKFLLKFLVVYLIFLPLFLCAQQNIVEFLPAELQFSPLKANHQEARIGILYYPKTGYLKVDIGNNIDLLKFHLDDEIFLNLGIEFMAYALSTNYQGKRLQIDALDGFFGGHLSIQFGSGGKYILTRIRIIHNSAHFVDGHYDNINDSWRDGLKPIPFTQDFGEITIAPVLNYERFSLKYFGSIAYSTLVRPWLIKKYSFNAGFEISSDKIINQLLDKPVNLFIANYNRYAGMPDYKISTNNLIGVKFGEWEGKGIIFYLSYYYGNDVLSEYYYRRSSKFGIGFNVDF